MPTENCGAYTHSTRGMPLSGGGRRHRRCKRKATQTRVYTMHSLAWEAECTVSLCGPHAAMFDRGDRYFLRSEAR